MLCLCHEGFERLAGRELSQLGAQPTREGVGFVLVEASEQVDLGQDHSDALPCFTSQLWVQPREVRSASVNGHAAALVQGFYELSADHRFDAHWPLLIGHGSTPGLGKRAKVLEREVVALLRKRMSRVSRLAQPGVEPGPGQKRGLFVLLEDFDLAHLTSSVVSSGSTRMALPADAPSRSYLKIEEAFAVFGQRPEHGQRVVDLGAAPGGWSLSAARRGARVTAIDNADLRGAATQDAGISHLREDAFTYRPPRPVDWLLCDVVDNPYRVLERVRLWLEQHWCTQAIVNLKFGHHDPLALLRALRSADQGLGDLCDRLLTRHLFHDRQELTVLAHRSQRG